MTRAELKAKAKSQLHNNWGWAACIGLVFTLINGLIFSPSIGDSAAKANNAMDTSRLMSNPGIWAGRLLGKFGLSFLSGFFMLSIVITFLALSRGHRFTFFKSIFSVFTDKRFVPEFLNYLLSYIFQGLWTLLLVIPGIVKSYSYALTPYIVNDMVESGKEIHATTGINESRKLMVGHKWQLFVLDLSFIGWFILGGLTLGIGFIWVIPYLQTTRANFYRSLAGDQFRQ